MYIHWIYHVFAFNVFHINKDNNNKKYINVYYSLYVWRYIVTTIFLDFSVVNFNLKKCFSGQAFNALSYFATNTIVMQFYFIVFLFFFI